MPPGGKVVSCASKDSPVASLPFKIGRNWAFLEVFTGNFSNEYVAEGNELSSVARASNPTVAGKEPAANRRHISRRVIDIRTSRGKVRNPARSYQATADVPAAIGRLILRR